jgi:phosphatidylinositol alpha-1,6-mannosyltransferase
MPDGSEHLAADGAVAGAGVRAPRLLMITPDFPPARGGIQVMAYELARLLRGFDTHVLAPAGAGAREFDAQSAVAVHRVDARLLSARARNLQLNASALLQARRIRPVATLAMHIVASPAAVLIRRLTGAPTVHYFHAKEIPDKPRLAAFAASRADAVIAVSSYTAGLIAATGATPRRMSLIPPGVQLPSRPRLRERTAPTVVTISRLRDRYKGHDVLIAALAQVRAHVPDLRWVVIGDGPLRAELEALARARGVADLSTFLGTVGDEERDAWLRRADVLAMPSRLPGQGGAGDGFGIVYLEAAACGVPAVAGNVGGAVDAVADGVSGLLVDPTDPAAVADAITKLLLDPELAARLGLAAAQRAQQFAWALIAARVEALLYEQLGPAGRVGEADPAPLTERDYNASPTPRARS